MRFEESIHWPEGLFLHPHHLQQLQYSMELRDRRERSFYLAYPYGLINFQIDEDALQNQRVAIRSISAVMPSGVEISVPGNAQIPVLDLSKELEGHHDPFLVYLALPLRSEHDGNMAESEGSAEKRLFSLHESLVNDENTGDNEVAIVRHRVNARIVPEFASMNDMETIPLMRLIPISKENMQPKLQLDPTYIPPFITLSADCPLEQMLIELDIQLKKRCNKLLQDLSELGVSDDSFTGGLAMAILQLQTLNRHRIYLHTMISSGRPTPFEMFTELRILLGELTSLQPLREIQIIPEYNHLNYAPLFLNMIQQIRLLIQEKGVSGFSRIEFEGTDTEHQLLAKLQPRHFEHAEGWYLAITCNEEPRWIVSAVENGDHFKMIYPSGADDRVRGVKLSELRYPPRFLPVVPNAVWFVMQVDENPHVWEGIQKESAILLDWGEGLFPQMAATMFITTQKPEDNA